MSETHAAWGKAEAPGLALGGGEHEARHDE